MSFSINSLPLIKIFCRFFLQLLFEKSLVQNLDLDDIIIDIDGFRVKVNNLYFNVNILNDVFKKGNVPLDEKYGFIESIYIDVPWSFLWSRTIKVNISKLQLTFESIDNREFSTEEDAVNSFLSIYEIAGTCMRTVGSVSYEEWKTKCIFDRLLNILSSIFSRLLVELEDTTIRIEQCSVVDSMATAFEIRCKSLQFSDNKMRVCEQVDNSSGHLPNEEDTLEDIADLNRVVVFDGIELYTDGFLFDKKNSNADDTTKIPKEKELRAIPLKVAETAGQTIVVLNIKNEASEINGRKNKIDIQITVENFVAQYDHNWIKEDCNLKLRAVIKTFNLNACNESNLWKIDFSIKSIDTYLCKMDVDKPVEFDKMCVEERKIVVPFFETSDILVDLQIHVETDELNNSLVKDYEINCHNAMIQMWLCVDVSSALANMALDIFNTEIFQKYLKREDKESQKFHSGLPETFEKLVQDCVAETEKESNLNDDIEGSKSTHESNNDDKFFELGSTYEQGSLSNDILSFTDEDGFLIVCAEEPRIHYDDDEADRIVTIDNNHFEDSDKCRATELPTISKASPIPLHKLLITNITILVHIHAGKDLSGETSRNFPKENDDSIAKPTLNDCKLDQVVVEFSNITFFNSTFGKDSKTKSQTMFSIYDIIVYDYVQASEIRKVIYTYSSEDEPRRSNTSLICVRMLNTHENHGKMRVSMLPIKINLDQDTLEFLKNFIDEIGTIIKKFDTRDDTEIKNDATERPDTVHDTELEVSETYKTGSSINCQESDMNESCTRDIRNNSSPKIEVFNRETTVFMEFVFSPEVKIYIDYNGKNKTNMMENGALFGLLMAFGKLNKLPIVLTEIQCNDRLVGEEGCITYATSKWWEEAVITNMITSFGPLNSVSQVSGGIFDLLRLPMKEMRRQDGYIVRGIQNGVGSFEERSLAEIICMTKSITENLQCFAERWPTFLAPMCYSLRLTNRSLNNLKNQLRPNDCEDDAKKFGSRAKKY